MQESRGSAKKSTVPSVLSWQMLVPLPTHLAGHCFCNSWGCRQRKKSSHKQLEQQTILLEFSVSFLQKPLDNWGDKTIGSCLVSGCTSQESTPTQRHFSWISKGNTFVHVLSCCQPQSSGMCPQSTEEFSVSGLVREGGSGGCTEPECPPMAKANEPRND